VHPIADRAGPGRFARTLRCMHTADPVWPVLALAALQALDAWMSYKPLPFVAQCLRDVRFPERYWGVIAPVKLASAIGLVAGLWWAWLGVLTGACLVAYFAIAVTMHVRARDLGRNAFNATALGVVAAAVTWWCFLS